LGLEIETIEGAIQRFYNQKKLIKIKKFPRPLRLEATPSEQYFPD